VKPTGKTDEEGGEMLEDVSFDAVITEGRIQHQENLRPWEGKSVQVTVHVRLAEDAPPADLDVEKDVYRKMPVKSTVIGSSKIRDIGPAKPSLILPEGTEDE
jgi:hypothetical protein